MIALDFLREKQEQITAIDKIDTINSIDKTDTCNYFQALIKYTHAITPIDQIDPLLV